MKKILVLLILLVIGYIWINHRTPSNDWVIYNFGNGNLEVLFPVTPDIPDGPNKDTYIAFARTITEYGELHVSLLRSDGLPFPKGSFYTSTTKGNGASVDQEIAIFVDGYTGTELYLSKGNMRVIERHIDYNDKMITQTFIFDENNRNEAVIKAFFDSLKIK